MLGEQPVPVGGTGNRVGMWNEVAASRDDRYETLRMRHEGATWTIIPLLFTATARKCLRSIFVVRHAE